MPESVVAPSAIIGPDVVIGDGCEIGPNCVIEGAVTIGDRTVLAAGCMVGTRGRPGLRQGGMPAGRVEIGADVLLLEHVVVNAPLAEVTRISDRSSVGPLGLIAHDVEIGTDVIVAGHVALGGYVSVGDRANLGLGVRVHPRLVVGAFAMCGMGAVVTRHVSPGVTVQGNPARAATVNAIGLQRGGIGADDQAEWEDALRSGRPPRPGGALAAHVEMFRGRTARWGRARPALPDHHWLSP
ncbi:hypothetical protein ACQP2E_18530 [Actinoplanes sp. CA-015351]|uniref:hypothetical protein n=1 Tax=Actinoplanes sp. CA-015351 TaxID=3239897 RepID=UPI003D959599